MTMTPALEIWDPAVPFCRPCRFYDRKLPVQTRRKPHLVAMTLKKTPLWLYLRSVRSSEKSVKL